MSFRYLGDDIVEVAAADWKTRLSAAEGAGLTRASREHFSFRHFTLISII